jgi:hypothetical protein
VRPSTREWLIEHNGEALLAEIVDDIRLAGRSIASDPPSASQSGSTEFLLSDEATDWIEAIANDEVPRDGS